MQAIHVKRYAELSSWAGTIEPEDRGWILFVAVDGGVQLWRAASTTSDDGQIIHGYELARDGVVEPGAIPSRA